MRRIGVFNEDAGGVTKFVISQNGRSHDGGRRTRDRTDAYADRVRLHWDCGRPRNAVFALPRIRETGEHRNRPDRCQSDSAGHQRLEACYRDL